MFHTVLYGWCWFLGLVGCCQSSLAGPPDIVIFISDDQSREDCTPYGGRGITTPSMQRLANAGLTFERAYVVSPSCAPSRAALLTGLNPARNGAEANHSRPRAQLKKWPAFFQELGYEVVAFGKVSHYKHTSEYGFDYFAHDTFHDHAGIPAAIQFLKQRDRQQSKPLCLLVGSNWPHVPWPDVSPDVDPLQLTLPPGSIDTPETRHWRAKYASAVGKGDTELGLIMDAVEQTLPRETVFVYTADHGAQWPFAKWNLYEAGVAVPLIVRWPEKIAAGKRTQAMVNWTDLLPTLLEIAGASPPADLDGQSFRHVLGDPAQSHRRLIFTTHSNDGKVNVYPAQAVRNERFKLIRNLKPENRFTTHIDLPGIQLGQREYFATWEKSAQSDAASKSILERYHTRPAEELYDLQADPGEQHNLINDSRYQEVAAELRQALASATARPQ